MHARFGVLDGEGLVAQPERQRLRRQRWQRVRGEDAAIATAADEPLLFKAVRRRPKLGEGEGDGRRRRRGRLEYGLRASDAGAASADAQMPRALSKRSATWGLGRSSSLTKPIAAFASRRQAAIWLAGVLSSRAALMRSTF